MRYLKKFEGWDVLVPSENQYGDLTKEFIEDMFIEISDDGYNISVFFDKRAITSVNKEEGKMIISSIPYIWVRCSKNIDSTVFNPNELEQYRKSNGFKEIIETSNDRLKDHDWYISDITLLSNQIRIFIHRIEDKKYVV